ncbi:MAG: electron transport complex subunit RsxA [Candidatus Latescibacteria bacterium]|jgi:Na+-translocating ferredoxin:NAD+ oxidoreductase subunit A|nr:electron transport complex subunit RsxA [Candidatus Latescibacterota bacterium]
MDIGRFFVIIIGVIFINNFVLAKFLGICPYIGVSKKLDSAIGMGFAVTFVMTVTSVVTWIIYMYILNPETNILGGVDLSYLRTIAFIIVIASLVQFVEMVIQKVSPVMYNALGIYLPLITTNCAVLGVAVLNIDEQFNFIESLVRGFGAGIGFTIALVLMAGLREKFEMSNLPRPLRGIPIAFVMASLMSLAFMGFSGLALK